MNLSAYLSELFSAGGTHLARSIALWRAGRESEIEFWSQWFKTEGLDWNDDYKARTTPQKLVPWIKALFPEMVALPIRVLDVGAGPVTKIGFLDENVNLEVTPVDPLAREYDRIMEENNVTPPLRTTFAFAEDLSARFNANVFDVVNCTNALDHSIEPMWGLIEMLIVCKRGGTIILGHRRNEAEFEGYGGLHQWNFDLESNDFIIWNKSRRVNASRLLDGVASSMIDLNGAYLTVTITKTAELPIDPLVYQRALRASMLETLMRF